IHEISLDTTLPIEEGINEIVKTLFEAVLLVILVVFIFLQNWRATLIPLLTVPVSLISTFIVFPMLGFTINTLSLLGLVLAIGIVVDDAIVVVEDFNLDTPRTKDFIAITKNLKVSDKKLLMILLEANKNVYLSARNVIGANVQLISGLNTYKVLDAGVVVFTESALSAVDNILI
ncbi:MAG: ribosomal protein, partial [Bacteroidetes bacterium]|nr:ribosomal protein [Bacteroidota bacterium]